MRERSTVVRSAVLVTLALILGDNWAARAQGIPTLFDASWMGFETGSFPDGFGPVDVAMGDLDGDGDLDAVVAQAFFGGPGVSVLLAHGNGTFGSPTLYALPYNDSVGRVALDDVDGDGDLDVLATIPDSYGQNNEVGLWRNDGTGVLAAPERLPTGVGPVGIAVADFDGDGFRDVVTADYGYIGQGTTVSLLRHNGLSGPGAGFLAPQSVAVGDGPSGIDVADVDGDDDIDVVVAYEGTSSTEVAVLRNDGAGNLTLTETYPVMFRAPSIVALGDLDNDGDADMVTTASNDAGSTWWGVTQVWRNDGAGLFVGPESYDLDTFSWFARDFALADLNGDCYLDIISTNPDGRAFEGWRVLLSDGALGFLPADAYPQSQNTDALAAVDVDGDFDVDVLTLAKFSASLTVHRNPGGGQFRVVPSYPVDSFLKTMAAGDVDGDGDLDIAVSAGITIQLLLNDGDGTFPAPSRLSPSTSVTDLALVDMDGDRLDDLLIAAGANIVIARSAGGGAFLPPQSVSISPCNSKDIGAFDIDGDQDLDVVVTGCVSGAQRYMVLARNDGGGSLTVMPDLPTYVSSSEIEAADLNGDQHLDLVTIESGFGLGAFLGNGDFTFAPEIRGGSPPYRFDLGHMDNDGIVDAVVALPADSFGTDRIGVSFGVGDGSFMPPVEYNGSSVLEALRVATALDLGDLDCDGTLDVVVSNYASNDHSVLTNVGDGTLRPQVRYGVGHTPLYAVIGDFTGDGILDIATDAAQMVNCCDESIVILAGSCGCGNGAVDAGEECDDGNTLPGDGCSASCRTDRCGDGLRDPGEECDDGNVSSGDGCRGNCTLEVCGDCIVDEPAETCDTGGASGACPAGCGRSGCGDGVLDPGEECDDGNTFPGDGCDGLCRIESCLVPDLSVIRQLKAVRRSLVDAELSWLPDPVTPGYHLNVVELKEELLDPRRSPVGSGVGRCDVAAPTLTCTDLGAVDDPLLLIFYQLLSACGSDGLTEGPY